MAHAFFYHYFSELRGRKASREFGADDFRLRDLAASAELQELLSGIGIKLGNRILGWPAPQSRVLVPDELTSGDVVCLTCRVPLNDDESDSQGRHTPARKKIRQSGDPLERAMFDCAEATFMRHSSRRTIAWRRELEEAAPLVKRFSGVEFNQVRGVIPPNNGEPEWALGWLLYAPTIKPIPGVEVRFLAAFAMGGIETWHWLFLLRRRYEGLVKTIVESDDLWFVLAAWPPVTRPADPASLEYLIRNGNPIDHGGMVKLQATAPLVGTATVPNWQIVP
jgi:hypothetical protein